MSPLAESLGVSRAFGPVLAVEDVHLQVGTGEVVGLLGANGAGKTTLIRLLLGLLRATGGQVRLFGEEPSRRTRRRIGYVPQSLGLYEDLTAAENLEFAHEVFGGERAEVPATLRSSVSVPVGRLSLGVQRRLAFVQALAHRPELLVLDEPTSGVDPLARARLWETIRQSAEARAGVLVTTHSMDEAEECDRLVVMAGGRVVAEGTRAQIVGSAEVTVVRSPAWQRAFDALDEAGIPAALVGRILRVPGAPDDRVRRALGDLSVELDRAPATLEERFLELTLAGGR